jgi:hypothetical protein
MTICTDNITLGNLSLQHFAPDSVFRQNGQVGAPVSAGPMVEIHDVTRIRLLAVRTRPPFCLPNEPFCEKDSLSSTLIRTNAIPAPGLRPVIPPRVERLRWLNVATMRTELHARLLPQSG